MFSNAAAVIVLTSIGMAVNAADLPRWRAPFDLSPAEAKLAAGAVVGRTLEQAADDAKVRTALPFLNGKCLSQDRRASAAPPVALLMSAQPIRKP